jgi:TolA-binding protein
VAVTGLCVLAFADTESGTHTEAEQHFEKANELRKLADYDAAIAEYQKVIRLSPNSRIAQDAQYWIGQSCFRAGRFDEALSAFQKLLDEYPASAIIPSAKLMMERARQAKKSKSLFEAAVDGDIEQVKLLLTNGISVDIKDRRGRTALYLKAT